jgi:UDP-N-acetylmuramoyl-tripeptide--D-alanyl-D-alanine ligase
LVIQLELSDIVRVIGSADSAGDLVSTEVSGFSIDTRTLEPGDLFFALRGDKMDGHAFVAQAFAKGAIAAVVDGYGAGGGLKLKVADTLEALQRLARWARKKWGKRLVAVTGSAGKTSTKDVIAALVGSKMSIGKTIGNFNNHFGLPLSILRLPSDWGAAVLELGMNHAGEIRALADLCRPDIGVVTNVGYAHIENFASVDGIALAKRELIEALAPSGIAVLNADDERVREFSHVHTGDTVTFGLSPGADVRAEGVELRDGGVRFRVDDTQFESPLPGRHGVRNILAGIAVAQLFGIAPEDLQEAVRTLAPGKMRGERYVHDGIPVIDDCYNSNPDAARAMLDVLRETPARRRIAVLGEMLELGRWAEPLHRDVGNYAAVCGFDVLVGIRGAACYMVDAVKRAGLTADAAFFFDDPEEAGRLLRTLAQPGDVILFKGSRGVHVERALEEFLIKAGN